MSSTAPLWFVISPPSVPWFPRLWRGETDKHIICLPRDPRIGSGPSGTSEEELVPATCVPWHSQPLNASRPRGKNDRGGDRGLAPSRSILSPQESSIPSLEKKMHVVVKSFHVGYRFKSSSE